MLEGSNLLSSVNSTVLKLKILGWLVGFEDSEDSP